MSADRWTVTGAGLKFRTAPGEPMLTPIRFIGEEIEVVFDEPPVLEKKPGCPDAIIWNSRTLRVVERISEWSDLSNPN